MEFSHAFSYRNKHKCSVPVLVLVHVQVWVHILGQVTNLNSMLSNEIMDWMKEGIQIQRYHRTEHKQGRYNWFLTPSQLRRSYQGDRNTNKQTASGQQWQTLHMESSSSRSLLQLKHLRLVQIREGIRVGGGEVQSTLHTRSLIGPSVLPLFEFDTLPIFLNSTHAYI